MSKTETSGAPEFTVAVDVRPDATLIRCSGRLVLESGATLCFEVQKLIRPAARLVLDLTELTHCDSMGIGAVISLLRVVGVRRLPPRADQSGSQHPPPFYDYEFTIIIRTRR